MLYKNPFNACLGRNSRKKFPVKIYSNSISSKTGLKNFSKIFHEFYITHLLIKKNCVGLFSTKIIMVVLIIMYINSF